MQGSGLPGGAITIPGVECVAAALYDGRHTLAKEITGNESANDAAIGIAGPQGHRLHRSRLADHWHRRVVVDACNAGKDIYCEKPCRTTWPTVWPWSKPRRRIIASCRSVRSA